MATLPESIILLNLIRTRAFMNRERGAGAPRRIVLLLLSTYLMHVCVHERFDPGDWWSLCVRVVVVVRHHKHNWTRYTIV